MRIKIKQIKMTGEGTRMRDGGTVYVAIFSSRTRSF